MSILKNTDDLLAYTLTRPYFTAFYWNYVANVAYRTEWNLISNIQWNRIYNRKWNLRKQNRKYSYIKIEEWGGRYCRNRIYGIETEWNKECSILNGIYNTEWINVIGCGMEFDQIRNRTKMYMKMLNGAWFNIEWNGIQNIEWIRTG